MADLSNGAGVEGFAPLGDSVAIAVTETDQRVTLPAVPASNPVIRLAALQGNMPAIWVKLGNGAVTGSLTTSMRMRAGSIEEPAYIAIGAAETHLSIFCEGAPGTVMLTVGKFVDGSNNANPQFTTIELGDPSDTTISRASAGVIAVEGRNVLVAATDAEIRSAAAGNFGVTAASLESAAAAVALTDAATVAVDWDTAINFSLTVTADRIIGNPTNGQAGTWRTILVQGNSATLRAITFDTNFLGDVPVITDCTSTKWYQLMLHCVSTSHFVVSSKRAKG